MLKKYTLYCIKFLRILYLLNENVLMQKINEFLKSFFKRKLNLLITKTQKNKTFFYKKILSHRKAKLFFVHHVIE